MLVSKSESTSKLPMKTLLTWRTVPSAKAKESFTVDPLNVIQESFGTKYFASLQLRVPIAESIGLNGGQTSVIVLCTWQSPYKIPSLLSIVLIFK